VIGFHCAARYPWRTVGVGDLLMVADTPIWLTPDTAEF
jgi:hypothetical protein